MMLKILFRIFWLLILTKDSVHLKHYCIRGSQVRLPETTQIIYIVVCVVYVFVKCLYLRITFEI